MKDKPGRSKKQRPPLYFIAEALYGRGSAIGTYLSHSDRKRSPKAHLTAIAAITMLMGAICGVVYALGLTQEKFGPLSDYITMYFSGNTAFSGSGGELFFECFMKYGKTAAVLWIIAFIPQAIFLTLPLLFVKGMTLGFTATFFVRLFGASGIYNAILLFLLQNIILVPTYIFITVSGFSFAIGKLLPAKAVHKTGKGLFAGIKSHFSQISALSISEYTVVLIIGAACVALAGMIEVFILPHLVNFLGRTGL